jgi:hypothetical protein
VQVEAHLNRTASWVADPIEWTVDLICPPTYDVIADDMAPEKLQLDGLELVGAFTERLTGEDGSLVHRVHYQLRTYEIGLPALKIAPMTVRYFIRRPGQRPEDLAPAGQVDVPGAQLAWRSTMPAGLKTLELRDARSFEPVPALLRVAQRIGWVLIGFSIAPVALWAIGRLRQVQRPRERKPSRRRSRRDTRQALEALLSLDVSTSDARRDAYAQLGGVLRRFLATISGAPAAALTFDEVTTRVGPDAVPGGSAILDALEACDRACYGPTGNVPSADQFRASVNVLTRVL